MDEYLARLREGPARAELIEASVLASYDLLNEMLQDRWRALAVFPGTFDRAGAVAVWDVEETMAQKSLSELVRYSMLEWDAPRIMELKM